MQHRPSRPGSRARLTGLVALLPLLAALLAGLTGCGPSTAAAARPAIPAPGMDVGTQVDAALPGWLTALPLRDGAGRTVRLSEFAGKTLVVSDTMTLCQETCPIDTAAVVQTAARVAADGAAGRVEFLSITVDPQRDTPAQIAGYRKLYAGAPSNWQVLTGSPDDVARLWSFFGVYRQRTKPDPGATNWRTGAKLTYDVEHSDEVFFCAAGQERFVLEGVPDVPDPSRVPARLRAYLSSTGRGYLQRPPSTSWTVPQALATLSWLTQRRLA
ncbi:protein SCO1/2 [Friedmanniella endophytica]|uniref:Protein SCO1/2 n=1 Tax=Microlunatus kandeliicorticis TaxID=1759536 RepID=A0A7W3IUL4_9ACTN|nr:SCO family protein [Microlunatus kandeliicorticis]MBA8795415.1 protein SCO1/2 [Microlunatus kandeliicorticis]